MSKVEMLIWVGKKRESAGYKTCAEKAIKPQHNFHSTMRRHSHVIPRNMKKSESIGAVETPSGEFSKETSKTKSFFSLKDF